MIRPVFKEIVPTFERQKFQWNIQAISLFSRDLHLLIGWSVSWSDLKLQFTDRSVSFKLNHLRLIDQVQKDFIRSYFIPLDTDHHGHHHFKMLVINQSIQHQQCNTAVFTRLPRSYKEKIPRIFPVVLAFLCFLSLKKKQLLRSISTTQ